METANFGQIGPLSCIFRHIYVDRSIINEWSIKFSLTPSNVTEETSVAKC